MFGTLTKFCLGADYQKGSNSALWLLHHLAEKSKLGHTSDITVSIIAITPTSFHLIEHVSVRSKAAGTATPKQASCNSSILLPPVSNTYRISHIKAVFLCALIYTYNGEQTVRQRNIYNCHFKGH